MNDQPEHDERWLRDGLAAALPDPPANPSRAEAAAALAGRRRRTTLAVAGAVAAVVVVAGVSAVLGTGGGSSPAPDEPADDASTQAGDCPPLARSPRSDDFFDEPDPALPGEVPAGAAWARLCAGNGNRLDVPTDVLVSGVELLTQAVNDLPPQTEDVFCTEELGFGYRLVFGGYDDRADFVVSGALYGCGFVTVGSDQRTGAEELLRTFGDLLREDRAARPQAEWEPPPPSAFPCDDPPTVPAVARPEDIEVAALCVRSGDDDYRRADIPDADLEVLRESFRDRIGNHGMPRCAAAEEVSIVGITAWGEQVAMPPVCGIHQLGVLRPWGFSAWGPSWLPGPEARAILERLVTDAR